MFSALVLVWLFALSSVSMSYLRKGLYRPVVLSAFLSAGHPLSCMCGSAFRNMPQVLQYVSCGLIGCLQFSQVPSWWK